MTSRTTPALSLTPQPDGRVHLPPPPEHPEERRLFLTRLARRLTAAYGVDAIERLIMELESEARSAAAVRLRSPTPSRYKPPR